MHLRRAGRGGAREPMDGEHLVRPRAAPVCVQNGQRVHGARMAGLGGARVQVECLFAELDESSF